MRSDSEHPTPENNRRSFVGRTLAGLSSLPLAGMLASQAHAQPARPAPA